MNRNGIRSSLEPLDILEDRVDDGLTAYAGLPIVIEAWYGFGLDKVCKEQLRLRERQSCLSDAQWAEVLTVLVLAGGRTVEDLDAFLPAAGRQDGWRTLPHVADIKEGLSKISIELSPSFSRPESTEVEARGSADTQRGEGPCRIG